MPLLWRTAMLVGGHSLGRDDTVLAPEVILPCAGQRRLAALGRERRDIPAPECVRPAHDPHALPSRPSASHEQRLGKSPDPSQSSNGAHRSPNKSSRPDRGISQRAPPNSCCDALADLRLTTIANVPLTVLKHRCYRGLVSVLDQRYVLVRVNTYPAAADTGSAGSDCRRSALQ